jgi:hypothetical protein
LDALVEQKSRKARSLMNEHVIRLRGGWTCAPSEGETRLSLPSGTLRPLATGFVLTRPFQAPRRLAPEETVRLRIEHTPGLDRIRLDGRVIFEAVDANEPPKELDVTGALTGRCVLVLEVGGGDWTAPVEGWGHVALVIRGEG